MNYHIHHAGIRIQRMFLPAVHARGTRPVIRQHISAARLRVYYWTDTDSAPHEYTPIILAVGNNAPSRQRFSVTVRNGEKTCMSHRGFWHVVLTSRIWRGVR